MNTSHAICLVGIGFLLVSRPLLAQSDQTSPAESRVLVVRSHEVKVRTVDGRALVAVDDLAAALGATLRFTGNKILLDLEMPTVPEPEKPSAEQLGTVRGVVNYYFNKYRGYVPDAGAKVWLLRGSVPVTANMSFTVDSTNLVVGGQSYPFTYNTIVGASGDYEVKGIAPGQYTIVLQSAHSNGKDVRDLSYSVEYWMVSIRPSMTLDGSHNFEMTWSK